MYCLEILRKHPKAVRKQYRPRKSLSINPGCGNHVGRSHVGRLTCTVCTGMLVPMRACCTCSLAVSIMELSRVIVRTCKCTGCTGMSMQVHGLHHPETTAIFANMVSANTVSVLPICVGAAPQVGCPPASVIHNIRIQI